MILPDSSAWVEYLRGTGSAVDRRLAELLPSRDDVAVAGPVLYEVLAGARSEEQARQLGRMLAAFRYLPIDDPHDFDAAAAIYRRCRQAGKTLRSHADCRLAAVAIRTGATVLHRDADFDAIAAVTPLVAVGADE